jgi:alkyl sulfatase BDS1-like metallo-beta-lactamase superfamily hydrolase
MPDLLALSARIIDDHVLDEPVNRVTQQLSELTDQLALVESFSHLVGLRTADGLVVFDASSAATAPAVVAALRGWDRSPVATLVYTHGHLDHTGGSTALLADAERRGHRRPEVVAHRAVVDRLARYRLTAGYNAAINARQFGWLRGARTAPPPGATAGAPSPAPGAAATDAAPAVGIPAEGLARFEAGLDAVVPPDRTYEDRLDLSVGGTELVLHHGIGETDDHTWVWLPAHRAICCGDFLIWNFPNAGNPQKVQRYPAEWAQALRAMAALEPELLVPAHGLPIAGASRIATVLDDVAGALERLVDDVLAAMNAGATLDEVVHEVAVPADTLALPYLRPLYDEPEFVVRNVWRRYGGWWDADPAHLHPPRASALAAEVAALAGGPGVLAARAEALAEAGDLRLAGQLAEWAAAAAPDDPAVHRVRAAINRRRRHEATSLMAKGIYTAAAEASEAVVAAGSASPVTRGDGASEIAR